MTVKDSAIARRAIADLDVETAKRHWPTMFPQFPLGRDAAVLSMLHAARTATPGIAIGLRVYSHDWLLARGLPSLLPDKLQPPRDQKGPPIIATGVGIAVNFRNPLLKPIGVQVQTAMAGAVLEAEADGKLADAAHVRGRMIEAKDRTIRKLVGR